METYEIMSINLLSHDLESPWICINESKILSFKLETSETHFPVEYYNLVCEISQKFCEELLNTKKKSLDSSFEDLWKKFLQSIESPFPLIQTSSYELKENLKRLIISMHTSFDDFISNKLYDIIGRLKVSCEMPEEISKYFISKVSIIETDSRFLEEVLTGDFQDFKKIISVFEKIYKSFIKVYNGVEEEFNQADLEYQEQRNKTLARVKDDIMENLLNFFRNLRLNWVLFKVSITEKLIFEVQEDISFDYKVFWALIVQDLSVKISQVAELSNGVCLVLWSFISDKSLILYYTEGEGHILLIKNQKLKIADGSTEKNFVLLEENLKTFIQGVIANNELTIINELKAPIEESILEATLIPETSQILFITNTKLYIIAENVDLTVLETSTMYQIKCINSEKLFLLLSDNSIRVLDANFTEIKSFSPKNLSNLIKSSYYSHPLSVLYKDYKILLIKQYQNQVFYSSIQLTPITESKQIKESYFSTFKKFTKTYSKRIFQSFSAYIGKNALFEFRHLSPLEAYFRNTQDSQITRLYVKSPQKLCTSRCPLCEAPCSLVLNHLSCHTGAHSTFQSIPCSDFCKSEHYHSVQCDGIRCLSQYYSEVEHVENIDKVPCGIFWSYYNWGFTY